MGKRLKQTVKVDFKQLNTTGMRVILLFAKLLESPKSLEELVAEYKNNPLIRAGISDDSIRYDINALRDAGCVISRVTKIRTKYALLEHPFEIGLKASHVKALKKIYNKVYENLSFEELLAIDSLLEKIKSYTRNENLKDELSKISKIADIDKDILSELLKYSSKNYQISINYKSKNGLIKKHDIVLEKIGFRHDKLYMFCYDLKLQKNAFYKVKNISEILNINIKKSEKTFEKFKATYKILNINPENYAFSDNEKLLEVSGKDLIIEAETDTEFIMMQDVLKFGQRCVVLSPMEFRNKIIKVIKDTKEVYANDKR